MHLAGEHYPATPRKPRLRRLPSGVEDNLFGNHSTSSLTSLINEGFVSSRCNLNAVQPPSLGRPDRSRSPPGHDLRAQGRVVGRVVGVSDNYASQANPEHSQNTNGWVPAQRSDDGRHGPRPDATLPAVYHARVVDGAHADLTKVSVMREKDSPLGRKSEDELQSAHVDELQSAHVDELQSAHVGDGIIVSSVKRGFKQLANVFARNAKRPCQTKRRRRLPHEDSSKVFRAECLRACDDELYQAHIVSSEDELEHARPVDRIPVITAPVVAEDATGTFLTNRNATLEQSPLLDYNLAKEPPRYPKLELVDDPVHFSSPRHKTPSAPPFTAAPPSSQSALYPHTPFIVATAERDPANDTLISQSREALETDALYGVLARKLKMLGMHGTREQLSTFNFVSGRASTLLKAGSARISLAIKSTDGDCLETLEREKRKLETELECWACDEVECGGVKALHVSESNALDNLERVRLEQILWKQAIVQHTYVHAATRLEKKDMLQKEIFHDVLDKPQSPNRF